MFYYDAETNMALRVENAVYQALKEFNSITSDEVDIEVGYDPITHTTAEQRAKADEDGICMNVFGEYVCINRSDTNAAE